MKVKLRELYESHAALNRLTSEKLPGRLAFLVARNIRVIQPEIADIEKQRMVIVERYGKPAKDKPGEWLIDPEKTEAFTAELDALFETEIELEIAAISLNEWPDNLSMTPADALALEYLVEGV